MFAHQVPYLISILFSIAILFPVFMIAHLLQNTSVANHRNRVLLFFLFYLCLVTGLCFAGVFDVVSLPPRIIVVTALPLLLFYLIVVSNTRWYNTFLKEVKLPALVQVHVFRFIGGFFLLLYWWDQLPATFACIAGCGDIITALTAPLIAKAIQRSPSWGKRLALVWNTFGLVDIICTSAMAVYLTQLNIETGSLGVDVLTQFPFCFIPALAPATIVFLHISIYRKIWSKKFHLS